jgi:hypothetical protein
MKFSPTGIYALNADGQAFPSFGWDWLTTSVGAGYGDFDTPSVGLWTTQFPARTLVRLGDFEVLSQSGFWANGAGKWLSQHQPSGAAAFTLDSSGLRFTDSGPNGRSAVGFVGDVQVFIRKPDFAQLILRNATSGAETTYDVPGFAGFVDIINSNPWWYSAGNHLRAIGLPDPYMPTSGGATFKASDGRVWFGGYVAPWGLCALPIVTGGQCLGYVLSGDGKDFYPDIFVRGDGHILVGSSETQGDTVLRVYDIDPVAGTVSLNGGPARSISLTDLFGSGVTAKKWVGWYYSSGRYGNFRPKQNCTVLALSYFKDGSGTLPPGAEDAMRAAAVAAGAIFCSGEQEDMDVMRERWDLVAGLLMGEGTVVDFATTAAAYRARLASNGLPSKPIIATLRPTQILSGWSHPAGVDAYAVEIYFDGPGAGSYAAQYAATVSRINAVIAAAAGVPVYLIAQAFDRLGTWTDMDQVAAIIDACGAALIADA